MFTSERRDILATLFSFHHSIEVLSFNSFSREVVALDATVAMLTEAKAKSKEEGFSNIKFVHGDATSLPFPDSSFGLVTSRLAIHHFTKPRPILEEMARVARPGGRVVIVDLVASEDQEQVRSVNNLRTVQAEMHNRLERLRDPSHTNALSIDDLATLMGQAGLILQGKVSN